MSEKKRCQFDSQEHYPSCYKECPDSRGCPMSEQKDKLREGIEAVLEAWQDEGKDYVVCHSFSGIAYEILPLIEPLIEEAKKQVAYELFEHEICPMCYRLNPQHATADHGEGCHECGTRRYWQALKGESNEDKTEEV